MKIDGDRRIIEATERELFDVYLKKGYDDLFPFDLYIARHKAAGTVVITEQEEERNVLKPCPFCGNAPTITFKSFDGCYRIDCVHCGIMFYLKAGAAEKSKERCIDAWNRRVKEDDGDRPPKKGDLKK